MRLKAKIKIITTYRCNNIGNYDSNVIYYAKSNIIYMCVWFFKIF